MEDHEVEKKVLTDPVFLCAFLANDLVGHFGGKRSAIEHSIGTPAVVLWGLDTQHQVRITIERAKA